MTRLADLAERRSLAVTLRIPFASSSKVTSSWACCLGMGGMLWSSNSPNCSFSVQLTRSP